MPEGIRTPDNRLRRPMLYPAELLAHPAKKNRKRVMGIEPTYLAWKASVLPLNYTRTIYYILSYESGWQDSNLRPLDPKSSALAKLSHTPLVLLKTFQSRLYSSFFVFVFPSLADARVIIDYDNLKVNTFFYFFLIFFKNLLLFTRKLEQKKPMV